MTGGPLILTVTQRGQPGVFVGQIEGTGLSLPPTKSPLLACARALLMVGSPPETVLILRWRGSGVDRIRGQIGVIVRKVGRPPKMAARKAPKRSGRVIKGK